MFASQYLCAAFRRRSPNIKFDALEAYKAIHGHLIVPQNFVVPNDANQGWSNDMLGLKLGKHVQYIRSDLKNSQYPAAVVQKLKQMGFVLDVHYLLSMHVLTAFQTFVKKFGHGNVPISFVIEKNDATWPKETRGFRLGSKLVGIRGGHFPELKDQLRELGVTVDNLRTPPNFERYFAALKMFDREHDHLNVPQDYREPTEGLRLGQWLYNVRRTNNFAEHRHRLEELGVNFSLASRHSEKDVLATFSAYRTIYGHLNVHPNFVVPSDDKRFPSSMWGVELGMKMTKWKIWPKLKAMGVRNSRWFNVNKRSRY